jgi:hypothetical protein
MRMNTLVMVMVMRTPSRAIGGRYTNGWSAGTALARPCPPPRRLKPSVDQRDRPRGLRPAVVIAVQDNHTRLVYAELHSVENATNVAVTPRRGGQWMCEQGLGFVEAVMSDDACCCAKSPHFTAELAELAPATSASRLTPRWNAKVERFFRRPRRRMRPGPPLAQLRHPRSGTVSVPTADALTALPAACHPPPAFRSPEGRTPSGSRRRARGRARARATDRRPCGRRTARRRACGVAGAP